MNQFLSPEFWHTVYMKTMQWLIDSGPSLIFIFIIWFIALRLYVRMIKKLQSRMIKVASMTGDKDNIEEKEKRVKTLVSILRQTGLIVIWVIFILIVLRQFRVDIGPILASAGIIGLAVGFGAQELVRDFISGFFVLVENQVREGDVAIINGTGGLVEKIALRTITLRDFSGVVHIFQHGKINTLSNMTKEWSAMVFDIGVAYKEDVDRVVEVVKKVGEDLYNDVTFKEKIIEPLEIFGIDKFGDSAVIIKARIKTKPIQQWTIGREFNGRLKKAFDAEHIEIPFPHRTIYWGDAISPLKINTEEANK